MCLEKKLYFVCFRIHRPNAKLSIVASRHQSTVIMGNKNSWYTVGWCCFPPDRITKHYNQQDWKSQLHLMTLLIGSYHNKIGTTKCGETGPAILKLKKSELATDLVRFLERFYTTQVRVKLQYSLIYMNRYKCVGSVSSADQCDHWIKLTFPKGSMNSGCC